MAIPVVDLFAGPGGLSEGFSRVLSAEGRAVYRVVLSVEKEADAHRTLLLRTFYRQFVDGPPPEYWELLRGGKTEEDLYAAFPRQVAVARNVAWRATLGEVPHTEVSMRVRRAVKDAASWVLVGGPPCQAYSVIGRARNRGIPGYTLDNDPRNYLYLQYLWILRDLWPSVFVLENVRGLLSSKDEAGSVIERVLRDLRSPGSASLGGPVASARGERQHAYRLYSLVHDSPPGQETMAPSDFVVRCEDYGIPQRRHRVIVVGVRDDLDACRIAPLERQPEVSVDDVLKGLPRVRSGLSEGEDSAESWAAAVSSALRSEWLRDGEGTADLADVMSRVREVAGNPQKLPSHRGQRFAEPYTPPAKHADWYRPWSGLHGLCHHDARGHMASDLHRYLFVASFGEVRHHSPLLKDFPPSLLPQHQNADLAVRTNRNFADRFRTQLSGEPATTITSHISRDGHYYIHPDPLQCRSLTVREAARLQTFPDDYYFAGGRTSQYLQVGNAVPPLLARQIAERLASLLCGGNA